MGRGGHMKGDDRNMGVTAGQEGVVGPEITGEFMTGRDQIVNVAQDSE